MNYMLRRSTTVFFITPQKIQIEAYLERAKQLRDSYNYMPALAREQAFNEEIL
jgi:hypothetical protein